MQRRMLASLGALATLGLAGCQQDQRPTTVVVVPTPAQAVCDTSFSVVNNSSGTVERLYFSSSRTSGWGADQLGTAVLPPGRFVNYRAANTGNYDFRVVWSNGRAAELMGVNVCRASRITITDRGLLAS